MRPLQAKKSLLKATILLVFVVSFTHVRRYLTPEAAGKIIKMIEWKI
jgi:hypothetical protein